MYDINVAYQLEVDSNIDPLACSALADMEEERGHSTVALEWRRKAFVLTELSKVYDGNGVVDPEKLFKQHGRFLKPVKADECWERLGEVEVEGIVRKCKFWWEAGPHNLNLELKTNPAAELGDWWWEQRRGWVIPKRAKGVPSDLVKRILDVLAEQLVRKAAEEKFK